MSIIGNKIKERRIELNMSQDELAKKMGYSTRTTIYKIEVGKNDVTQSKIEAFAKALDTTPSYLMGYVDDSEVNSDIISLGEEMQSHISEFIKTLDANAKNVTVKQIINGFEDEKQLTFKEIGRLANELGMSMDDMLIAILGVRSEKKEKPATISDDGPMDKWSKLIPLLEKVPQEQQDMIYNMIEAALKSHGLLK